MLDLQDAITLLEEGDPETAARRLEEVVEEIPIYSAARVLLARAYEAMDEWETALGVWRDALHLIPTSPVIRRGLERAALRVARATPPVASSEDVSSHDVAGQVEDADPASDGEEPFFQDLDRLIHDLESARIVPRPDVEAAPSADFDDDDDLIDDVVSETLARIYAAQGKFDEAARIYELLAGQQPEEAEEFVRKASELRTRASDES